MFYDVNIPTRTGVRGRGRRGQKNPNQANSDTQSATFVLRPLAPDRSSVMFVSEALTARLRVCEANTTRGRGRRRAI